MELSEFLRKNQRALRLATLQLLTLLVENYQTLLNKELINKILSELPALINESDLQIAQMSVALLTDLLKIQPASVSSVLDAMLAPICKLIQSPLLQGPSLAAVVEFLVQLNQSGLQRPSFKDLKDMLIKLVYDPQQQQGGGGAVALHRQSYQSSAKCLAALVAKRPQEAPQVTDSRSKQKIFRVIEFFSLIAGGSRIGREFERTEQVQRSNAVIFFVGVGRDRTAVAEGLGRSRGRAGHPARIPISQRRAENGGVIRLGRRGSRKFRKISTVCFERNSIAAETTIFIIAFVESSFDIFDHLNDSRRQIGRIFVVFRKLLVPSLLWSILKRWR